MRYIVVPVSGLGRPYPPAATPPVPDAPHVSHAPAAPVAPAVSTASTPASSDDPLGQWVGVARAALDPCVIVDPTGTVAAMSPAAMALLGGLEEVEGRRLLDDVVALIDFSDGSHPASAAARRVPPLIAAEEDQLSRGIMRVRLRDGRRVILDAVSAPLHDRRQQVVGSMSFLSAV